MNNKVLGLAILLAAVAWGFAGEKSDRGSAGTRSLTLDEAVRLALQQNPDIIKAKQEIERTRGLVIEVRAQALPHLAATGVYNQEDKKLVEDFGGSGSSGANPSPTPSVSGTNAEVNQAVAQALQQSAQSQQQSSTSAFSSEDKSWSINIEAQQLVYSGGQVSAALRIARFTQDSSYWSLRDTIDTVIAATRTEFYDVLLYRALITVQQESVELLQSQLKDQQSRFDAGTVPRFNVLQAEVALANQQPLLINAKNNYLIAQLALARTLGMGASEVNPGAPPITAVGELTVEPRSLDVATELALAHERRPFLKVQRLQILVEVEDIKVQLAGYQPRLSVNGGYTFRNTRANNDLSDVVNGWFFGANGSWDIFDGLATYGRVKQARAKLEIAKATYDDSVHQVDLETQQAIANVREARETIESQQKTVDTALEAVRLSRERFGAGAGTQLDILNAQVQLTLARSIELRARRNYNAAIAELDRVTDGATRYKETFDDPLSHRMRKATPAR